MTQIELFLEKSVEQNADIYFQKAKKLKKKIEGAKEAITIHTKKLEQLEKKKAKEKEVYEQVQAEPEVKKEWYQKFRWFYSSEGFLIIGGRDATTNEIVIKKHTDSNDRVFHTDMIGSPFFVVKTDGKQPSDQTIKEAANATVTFSRVFKLGQKTTPTFMAKPEQLTKTPKSGEYVPKGGFITEGKLEYIESQVDLAVGKLEDGRLMAAPLSAVKKHCKEHMTLAQGDKKTSEVAKKIKAKLGGALDDIIRILPAGGIEVAK